MSSWSISGRINGAVLGGAQWIIGRSGDAHGEPSKAMNARIYWVNRPQWIGCVYGTVYTKGVIENTSQGSSRVERSTNGKVARGSVDGSNET